MVAGRVAVHAEHVVGALHVDPECAEFECLLFGFVQIGDVQVEVGVDAFAGPVPGNEIGSALEGQGGRIVAAEFDPVVAVHDDLPSEEAAIELRQRTRVGTVEHRQKAREDECHGANCSARGRIRTAKPQVEKLLVPTAPMNLRWMTMSREKVRARRESEVAPMLGQYVFAAAASRAFAPVAPRARVRAAAASSVARVPTGESLR